MSLKLSYKGEEEAEREPPLRISAKRTMGPASSARCASLARRNSSGAVLCEPCWKRVQSGMFQFDSRADDRAATGFSLVSGFFVSGGR